MDRKRIKLMMWLIAFIAIAIMIWGGVAILNGECERASFLKAKQRLITIVHAVSRYREKRGALPMSLEELTPVFLNEEVIQMEPQRGFSTGVIIPQNPFRLAVTNGTYTVICDYYARGHTQISATESGDISVE
jgi:hypothetical protein